ncbi:MAG: hypothetical protein PVF32_23345 [Desulfobacterales bacterium]|jgi:ATP/maltotriose-dependent transcriptional regulator MalT
MPGRHFKQILIQTINEIMTRVLQYLPEKLHVLLLTRRDPPYPLDCGARGNV